MYLLVLNCRLSPRRKTEREIPETDVAETDDLETDDPETDGPETDVAVTDSPETDDPEPALLSNVTPLVLRLQTVTVKRDSSCPPDWRP